MKITILNVKYSPNLGDGAIAECLEFELSKNIPDAKISSLDIGGFDDYGDGGSILGHKVKMTQRLSFLPSGVQKWIRRALMPFAVKLKYAQKWHEELKDSDALVIGGGQLFMDVDNYFPMRITTAINESPKNIPIFVYAVGVSKIWTQRAINMFAHAFKHGKLVQSFVRDKKSQEHWLSHFGNPTPNLVRDPALLAADCYGSMKKEKSSSDRKIVALGVSDPSDLNMHVEKKSDVVCGSLSFYLEAIELLYSKGFDVMLFTNGADHVYLSEIEAAVKTLDSKIQNHVEVLPRSKRPIELVKQITRADALIAHRLHANILAYAYNIPHVGLVWDKKLVGFFKSIGREEYLVTEQTLGASDVVSLMEKTLLEGIDMSVHKKVLKETRDNIKELSGAIKKTMESSSVESQT